VHPHSSPEKLTSDVDVSVRPPQRGVNIASGVRGLGVEQAVVLEFQIGVAPRARGAGGGRLQANELAAPVQDEVALGDIGRMTPHATES